MEFTPHQAKYFALELTRRTASGDMHKLVPSLMDARVDSNPHQVQIIRKDIFSQCINRFLAFPSTEEITLVTSQLPSINFKTAKKNYDESN